MKLLLLLLTIAAGSVATVVNLQHFAAMKNQLAGVLPTSLSQFTANTPTTHATQPTQVTDDRNIYAANVDGADIDPSVPATSLESTDDVISKYGEPERKQRVWDGTYVWYYPYYVVYVGRRIVIHHRAANTQTATTQTSQGPRQGGSITTTSSLNRWSTGPATGSAGWRATTNSLGTVSLNGAPHRASWQGGGYSTGASGGYSTAASGGSGRSVSYSAPTVSHAAVSTAHVVTRSSSSSGGTTYRSGSTGGTASVVGVVR